MSHMTVTERRQTPSTQMSLNSCKTLNAPHTQVWWPEGSTLQVGAADGKCRPQLVRLKHYTEKFNLNSFIDESVCRSLEAWSETKDWQQAQPIRGGGESCVTSLSLLWSPALRMTSQVSVGVFQTNKILNMIQSEASLTVNQFEMIVSVL